MQYLDYNEKICHGTPEFPIEFYHVTGQHPRYHMPFHWHKEMEIIRVLKGSIRLFLDSGEIEAVPGDIIFINAGVIHGGNPNDSVYQCIVFDVTALLMNVEACRQYVRQISSHQLAVKNHFTGEDAPLCEAVNRLFQCMSQKPSGYELTTLGLLLEVFGVIFRSRGYEPIIKNGGQNQDKLSRLKDALEYIDDHYTANIKLTDLSKVTGLSPKYLCRYFQAVIHRSPIDYLNFYRIEQACYQFSIMDKSITETAYACGFNDTSYFIKMFKKFKGITPGQYQKQMGNLLSPVGQSSEHTDPI